MSTPIDHCDFPAADHLIVLRGGRESPRQTAFAPLVLDLMARASRVAVVDDAPAVMVELQRGGQAVVLIDEQRVAAELVTAVARYYPRVTLWLAALDAHHHPRLTRIASAASVSAASHPAEDAHQHAAAAPSRPPVTVSTAAVVSDEELAMLMSPLEE